MGDDDPMLSACWLVDILCSDCYSTGRGLQVSTMICEDQACQELHELHPFCIRANACSLTNTLLRPMLRASKNIRGALLNSDQQRLPGLSSSMILRVLRDP